MDHWKKVLKIFLGEKKLNEISLKFNVSNFIYIKNNDNIRGRYNCKNQ